MRTKTERILPILKVLTYIAMIGYGIQAGSQIISLIVSFYNPVAAKDIYHSPLDLFPLLEYSRLKFIGAMSFIIALSIAHVAVWYYVIRLFSTLNLRNPFTRQATGLLEKIGIQLLSIWGLSVIAGGAIDAMAESGNLMIGKLHPINEYLFFAGIVYIISQIFKRGIELQEESELTV